eukprot:1244048-Rhodomonas_salina.1
MVTKPDFSIRGTFNQTQHMSGHHTEPEWSPHRHQTQTQIRISVSFLLVPHPSDAANLTSTCTCNISTLMTAAPCPA